MVADAILQKPQDADDYFLYFAFAYHDARKGDQHLVAMFETLELDVFHCWLIQVFAELLDMKPLPEEKRLALADILEMGAK